MADAWERLQLYLADKLDGDAWTAAVGVHLGLAIALRHPEWAAAMNDAINKDGMERSPESKSTYEVASMVVKDLPIEVYDGE